MQSEHFRAQNNAQVDRIQTLECSFPPTARPGPGQSDRRILGLTPFSPMALSTPPALRSSSLRTAVHALRAIVGRDNLSSGLMGPFLLRGQVWVPAGWLVAGVLGGGRAEQQGNIRLVVPALFDRLDLSRVNGGLAARIQHNGHFGHEHPLGQALTRSNPLQAPSGSRAGPARPDALRPANFVEQRSIRTSRARRFTLHEMVGTEPWNECGPLRATCVRCWSLPHCHRIISTHCVLECSSQ